LGLTVVEQARLENPKPKLVPLLRVDSPEGLAGASPEFVGALSAHSKESPGVQAKSVQFC